MASVQTATLGVAGAAVRRSTSDWPSWRTRLLRVLLSLGVLLAVWWVVTSGSGLISVIRFPSPADTWSAWQQILWDGYSNARWHEHVLRSVLLVTMGFAVAASLGVALGLAMGASRTVEALANPAFLFLRPVPPLAWIPLAIVWLGLGDADKIMKDPMSVKGQTILLTSNSTGDCAVQSRLKKYGLQKSDVTIKTMGQAEIISALSSGGADPAGLRAPNNYSIEEKAGAVQLCSGKDGGAIVPGALMARSDYAEQNPENVAKFLAIYLRGWS